MKSLLTLAPVVALVFTLTPLHALPSSSVTTSVNFSPDALIPVPEHTTEGSCKYHPGGGTCPEHAPCCLNGYCSDNPRYCSTGCEPNNSFKESSCFPQSYCANIREEFNQPRLASSRTYNGNPTEYDFTTDYNDAGVEVKDSKLQISMRLDSIPNSYGRPQGLGSVVSTTRFMQYGKVTARMKAGSISPGVVTAFIVRNEDPGDEIDFEIVGRNPSEAQTNFYYRTPPNMAQELIDYSNTGKEALQSNTALDFHVYEIEWKPDYIFWRIDGLVIRSVFRNETKDDAGTGIKKFPSTPARIQFGIWDGGQGSNGTAAWAGTPTDWSRPDQVYQVQVDYVDIECYYQGNATQTWPPVGYGPTKIHKGPYITPGLNNGFANGDSSFNEHEGMRPFVPFYKNMKLMVPTGCLLGLALVIMGTIEGVRRRRLARVQWE